MAVAGGTLGTMPAMGASLTEALHALMALAPAAPPSASLVGGCVRDALLGRPVIELDVATPGARALADDLAAALRTRVVALGGPHSLYRVPVAGGHVDVAEMRGEIDDDLARRDFTVNALAVRLSDLPGEGLAALDRSVVVDQHDGLEDLDRSLLRLVSDGAIEDDPVRALRAARLVAVLGFSLDADTEAALASAVPGLGEVAAARVGAELERLMEADRAAPGVRVLERSGLLGFCFPALEEGRGVEQRPWHIYDVYHHQIAAFEYVDALLAHEEPRDPDEQRAWRGLWLDVAWPDTRWGPLRPLLDGHRVGIRLATLLHDVGKPHTRTLTADGRTRFFGHAELGAELATSMMGRWRLPRALTERVALLIHQHLRPGQVASPGEPPTERALHRFQRALRDATPDVCLLFLADSLATVGPGLLDRWLAYVAHVQRVMTWRPPEAAAAVRRFADGHAVMEATGLEPGRRVGEILDAIEEAAAAGEVRTGQEALALARRLAEPAERGRKH